LSDQRPETLVGSGSSSLSGRAAATAAGTVWCWKKKERVLQLVQFFLSFLYRILFLTSIIFILSFSFPYIFSFSS